MFNLNITSNFFEVCCMMIRTICTHGEVRAPFYGSASMIRGHQSVDYTSGLTMSLWTNLSEIIRGSV